jgi:hypothetical protein
MKRTLTSLACSCRQRIYTGAWLKPSPIGTRKQDIVDKAADGIDGLLINFAKKCLVANLAGAANLIRAVNDIKEELCALSKLDRN